MLVVLPAPTASRIGRPCPAASADAEAMPARRLSRPAASSPIRSTQGIDFHPTVASPATAPTIQAPRTEQQQADARRLEPERLRDFLVRRALRVREPEQVAFARLQPRHRSRQVEPSHGAVGHVPRLRVGMIHRGVASVGYGAR